ncbi:putative rapid ALkalinization Factor [Helianthus annuus]|uniref:Rapid ALkalinization Factor n=1 Tax=Helianthus annuus TaxID=4232 RepID=A0A9K3H5S6_HELAN|nr:protein RALF-like 32 [Helianthus annuus]KAF5768325.1 putative rapid ALkalinization Factor [Helianthus annuus]KAJ0463617.1 putative rapid ALkalinization Factor [Helianthus annuus]KAJ0467782.1 putative rapid ALkalinization Factor [Helianthus annuus]KAJ0485097.1 putative rapid ALkalinization Factor [Helianthus annuus]KAJ0655646.1 putative rapid ALkalinization Factor [Helianthus annuus]
MESKLTIKIPLLHLCIFFLTVSTLHRHGAASSGAENDSISPFNDSLEDLLQELLGSEITRRYLEQKKYISADALKRDQPVCNGGGKGVAYTKTESCTPPSSKPYNRGCSKIYRCER